MNEYHLADGSPRYGHRTETPADQPAAIAGVRVEEAAEGAARLGLDDMAAAIDRRLTSAWADKPDPSVREQNPEELAAARALVKVHLGTQRQWRMKAQTVRDKQLVAVAARRKASGSEREILALRLGLIIALVAPPAYIVATSQNVLKLLIVGAICFVAALVGGHFLTIRARVPGPRKVAERPTLAMPVQNLRRTGCTHNRAFVTPEFFGQHRFTVSRSGADSHRRLDFPIWS